MRIDGLILLIVALPFAATWIVFALAGRDEPRPYKPYDLSRADFNLRTIALGFLAAGLALALVIGWALASSAPR